MLPEISPLVPLEVEFLEHRVTHSSCAEVSAFGGGWVGNGEIQCNNAMQSVWLRSLD